MKKRDYVPERGDLIWLEFDPQTGHEQSGRRPAIILSSAVYNQPSGLALVCPVTSQVKGYPFEVPITEGRISGVILADQVKSVDWSERKAAFIGRVSDSLVAEVITLIEALLSD